MSSIDARRGRPREFATHAARGYSHYAQWIAKEHPDAANGFYPVLNFSLEVNDAGGGDTGAPQVAVNPVPREWYQTDWVADRTIAWLESLDADDDFFCWMSFPDPHHPWDPPEAEVGRYDWRDLDLPEGYPVDRAEREAILDAKPIHWRRWYDGTLTSNYEAPRAWVPSTLTPEQILENARAVLEAVGKAKPASFKGGNFIKSLAISSSMSPGVTVASSEFSKY